MITIPTALQTRFDAILVKKKIPERYHVYYKKWLRYYLDFCFKFNFKQSSKESVSCFTKKLQDKNQTDYQQEQASNAILLYFEKKELKTTHANWKPVYNDLNAEIQLRYYSPKTLKAYTGWARQLQYFTKSKEPQLLTSAETTWMMERSEGSGSTMRQS